jgi:amino acid transporter
LVWWWADRSETDLPTTTPKIIAKGLQRFAISKKTRVIHFMTQESVTQTSTGVAQGEEHGSKAGTLGPILCWAVVFADIGTSIYYVPGILYQNVHALAGFFVFLTMSVFVLLTFKYTEVTHRFPQGGGVVTVAAQAINPWFGALGGMFILVDYFLTAAISCLSGMLYLSVVLPALGPYTLWVTVGILILLGILNWVGVSESARVSLVGAVIAFLSDLAILFTVFTHISVPEFFSLIHDMFSGQHLTATSLLVGFAGSFLAFSGLESISQLSPVMRQPHKKVAGLAMLFVVLTIGITSPFLTLFSTLLQPQQASDPTASSQLISLLAGHWGSQVLQTEVAISASALLVFASNTAIIGAYHVFMALSRMDFLPEIILQRNKLRGTPHFSIGLATGIPIIVLILVNGNINRLGDMYAFGLLGAFTLTCLGLDIVRARDWRRSSRRRRASQLHPLSTDYNRQSDNEHTAGNLAIAANGNEQLAHSPDQPAQMMTEQVHTSTEETTKLSFKILFFLGILTTILVAIAWSTNLVTKPEATAFGGTVSVLGMIIAYTNHVRRGKEGRVPVPVVLTHLEGVARIPGVILAVLSPNMSWNDAVIRAAIGNAQETRQPLVFLYIGQPQARAAIPRMLEIVDPYLEDPVAKESFSKAEALAIKANIPTRRYIYLQGEPDLVTQVWQAIHPHDTVIAVADNERYQDINPDRVRYQITTEGKVAHLLKHW